MIIEYQAPFMYELEESLETLLEILFFLFVITFSMNLFKQLVIVLCYPVMEGYAPSGKGLVV